MEIAIPGARKRSRLRPWRRMLSWRPTGFSVHSPWFIALVTPHIPDKGQVMVRYYGLCANAHRGKVRKAGRKPFVLRLVEQEEKRLPSKGWAAMIRKVCEVDPMVCPKCGGASSQRMDERGVDQGRGSEDNRNRDEGEDTLVITVVVKYFEESSNGHYL